MKYGLHLDLSYIHIFKVLKPSQQTKWYYNDITRLTKMDENDIIINSKMI